jgi:hypothetical protein
MDRQAVEDRVITGSQAMLARPSDTGNAHDSK